MSLADPLQRLQRTLHGMLAALLLATVGLQALGPLEAPLERTHGSAFSVATDDVALAQVRRGEAARPAAALLPVLAAAGPRSEPAPATAITRPPLARPHSTGPPPYPHTPPQTGPRAPPAA